MTTQSHVSASLDFPFLSQKKPGQKWLYFDSAATSLKPWSVIERVTQFLAYQSVNVHRGAYPLAQQLTDEFEKVRNKVAGWLGAKSHEILWTFGTTDGLNWLRATLEAFFRDSGPVNVVVGQWEHHANFLPWRHLAQSTGGQFQVLPLDPVTGEPLWQQWHLIFEKVKPQVVAISACSNVLGLMWPWHEWWPRLRALAPQAVWVVDAAQWVGHAPLDLTQWDCDFLAWSGHKCLGPYGVGVLWGKSHWWERLPKVSRLGGGQVQGFDGRQFEFLESVWGFEAGTPNIEGVLGLGAAIEYLEKWDLSGVQSHSHQLALRLLRQLPSQWGLEPLVPESAYPRSLVTFKSNRWSIWDWATLLGQQGVMVRAGQHCCAPLHHAWGLEGTLRVSFHLYNSEAQVDELLGVLEKTASFLEKQSSG